MQAQAEVACRQQAGKKVKACSRKEESVQAWCAGSRGVVGHGQGNVCR